MRWLGFERHLDEVRRRECGRELLEDVAVGITRNDVISTAGDRLLRLASKATPDQEAGFSKVGDGTSLNEIASAHLLPAQAPAAGNGG